ncbi:FAD-dependent monooxygenase [Acidisoma cellulosilytica]|uniref:FAD-dependent monooxygenase n=1 Tax=Acidisoma cellulosilyticum TaxID=2802395 RepID=A0A963YYG1_9PROT|nr:FAD-dependent monooxygenase [Acidisoma cellulosilyticum]MCB8879471.1 FAD-dependent monooxygenase [Acidisoma cellulosilyticum]
MDQDVLIVGAGPTGLALAITLRRFGVSVRIIDKLTEPAAVSKALVIWSATLEALQGMGIVDRFLATGRQMHAVRVGDGHRELGQIVVGDGIDSAFPFPILLSQAGTERKLRERLAELGVTVERGIELTSVTQDEAGVTGILRSTDGVESTSRTRYVLGCDGARSVVRHAIGAEFEGLTEPQTFLLGDVKIDGGDLDDRSLYIWWHDGGTVALFPFEEGVWRIFTMRDSGPSSDEPTSLAELQEKMDRHFRPGATLRDPTWLSVFHINERLASHYRKGRCFVAGDAAHIHSPAGGQGMNTGIQDAVNLGWKLAYVIQGRGDPDVLLDSYEAERRPAARAVVDESTQRQHMAFRGGLLIDTVRDLAMTVVGKLPAVQKMIQVQLSETSITYHDGPLVALGEPGRRPKRGDVGTRALDATWTDAATGESRSLWPSISGERHSLLVFEDDGGTIDLSGVPEAATSAIDVLRFDAATDPDQAIRKRYHLSGPGWVLIRPDQVIAARGEGNDVAVLARYVDRVISVDPGFASAAPS